MRQTEDCIPFGDGNSRGVVCFASAIGYRLSHSLIRYGFRPWSQGFYGNRAATRLFSSRPGPGDCRPVAQFAHARFSSAFSPVKQGGITDAAQNVISILQTLPVVGDIHGSCMG